MTCANCIFSHRCNLAYDEAINKNIDLLGINNCNYWHASQNIITRNGKLTGVEILSRPRSFNGDVSYSQDDFFYSLSQYKHKILIGEIIEKTLKFNDLVKDVSYFVNVERFSLLDSDVVNRIILLNNFLKNHDSTLVVEVTERHPELSKFTREAKYKLKDNGVMIALDKFKIKHFGLTDLKFYDYIKFDCPSIIKTKNNNELNNEFIHFLYNLVEMGISTVAERVETEDEYNYIMSLPFTHLQGFYDKKSSHIS
ncbi:hypothetical protein AYI92_06650 [Shewanella xiamenensis]|uniref:EAL domain-containing protein n=1 Tax=Shewanella xiamenensis TaxID=332186 RepID=UPI0011866794|nr:EAL domain-containing protein [Shewanella xiamenensis]TVL21166.1 hypothetical protein AYI90_07035 [Shewanella xiamenensis]TVL21341.1 hypothetical protein AYI91_07835 [Shewanella xiamenensis]TVL27373.1 hypothetical protein AYI92_06650 [Shewanella xiamenensis]TVL34920.1 hypothetical protein AYI93_07265 [Shewanella xiamenensis]TVL35950.1 hypothetical protein AYI95_00295 [Shewanella xiamenensis]